MRILGGARPGDRTDCIDLFSGKCPKKIQRRGCTFWNQVYAICNKCDFYRS